jgi:hypothetical protein
MGKIFVRKRRRAQPGTRQPQFAVVAVAGVDVTFYRRSLRTSELEALGEALGAEIVHLPRGEGEGEGEGEPGAAPRPRHRRGRR